LNRGGKGTLPNRHNFIFLKGRNHARRGKEKGGIRGAEREMNRRFSEISQLKRTEGLLL